MVWLQAAMTSTTKIKSSNQSCEHAFFYRNHDRPILGITWPRYLAYLDGGRNQAKLENENNNGQNIIAIG